MSCQYNKINSSIFIGHPTSLMGCWKQLRTELTVNLTDLEQLQLVNEFWRHAPIQKYVINWDDPISWPDPWNLMHELDFDESSVALGMFYTLYLGFDQRWTSDRMTLMLINDRVRSMQKIILDLDGKWLLNYEYGTIVDRLNVPKTFTVQQRYTYNGKIHSMVNLPVIRNDKIIKFNDNTK